MKIQRNANATREAILNSATKAFGQHGYDGIGVRQIAKDAGVTGMMVNRYFGSKEKLFDEVVETAFAGKGIVTADLFIGKKEPEEFLTQLIQALLSRTAVESEVLNAFSILVKSVASPSVSGILRKKMIEHFENPLAQFLGGRNAKERAAILVAMIAGVQMIRQTLKNEALTDTNTKTLTRILRPLFENLIYQ